jgi:hypothetical protein
MKALVAVLVMLATPALAEEQGLREFCPDRPGLDLPACIVDKGHLQVELAVADWTLDKQPDSRSDTIALGDVSLRYGVGNNTELRLGWTAYGHVRTRDRMTGTIDNDGGIGDVTIGIKQSLHNPDGNGFSIALLPFATLPTGKDQIGQGTWGGALIVPVSYDISEVFTIEANPEVVAAVDQDGHGRHLTYGSAAGIQAKLGKKILVEAEMELLRDRDPEEHITKARAAFSFGYQPKDGMQFDTGANVALNGKTPDLELYLGVTRRF